MHFSINSNVSFWYCFAILDVVLAYISYYSLYIFFKVDASLGPMSQIFVSFFEVGNVVYGSFAIKALSIVYTLFFDLLNHVTLCAQ